MAEREPKNEQVQLGQFIYKALRSSSSTVRRLAGESRQRNTICRTTTTWKCIPSLRHKAQRGNFSEPGFMFIGQMSIETKHCFLFFVASELFRF